MSVEAAEILLFENCGLMTNKMASRVGHYVSVIVVEGKPENKGNKVASCPCNER